eukprot:3029318-Rhodomonas_salina.2
MHSCRHAERGARRDLLAVDELLGPLVVDGREVGELGDEVVEQRWLRLVRVVLDRRLVRQHHRLRALGVRRQQAPVDVSAVAQVRVVR